MSVGEELSTVIVVFLAALLGGASGGKIGGGAAWKSAIAALVGIPLSIVVFFAISGRGSVASLLAGQLLFSIVFTGLVGWGLRLRFRALLGTVIGACIFGAVATKASFIVIAARHTSPL